MTQVFSFAVNHWWIILAVIAVLPTVFWAIWPFIVGIIAPKEIKELISFRDYWEEIVQIGKDDRKHHWWEWILCTKWVRLTNKVSLLWIWGYLLLLIGYAIGVAINWIGKNLWRGLCAIGRGIAAIYRAI